MLVGRFHGCCRADIHDAPLQGARQWLKCSSWGSQGGLKGPSNSLVC